MIRNPRTHYATDAQEATAEALIESVRPAVDALNEKHPGTWGIVKTALAGLVYNDCNWVANSVAAALKGKGDPSVYIDARVGLKAVDGKWFSRKTPSQITTAVGEIGKLMRGERFKNPSASPLTRLDAKTLAERASKAGWHDTTAKGRKTLASYTAEMKRRLGRDPGDYATTLRAFYDELVTERNPRVAAGWSTHNLGGGKQWFKRLAAGSVNVQQLRNGMPYEARKIDSAGKQHHLGSAKTLAAAKALALGAKSNPRRPHYSDQLGPTVGNQVPEVAKAYLRDHAASLLKRIKATENFYTKQGPAYEGPASREANRWVRIFDDIESALIFARINHIDWEAEAKALDDAWARARYRSDTSWSPTHSQRAVIHAKSNPKRNPKPLSKKALDKLIEQIYYKHASGLQINIMDIGKVFKAGEEAYAAGGDVEQAVKDAIKAYCIKGNPGSGYHRPQGKAMPPGEHPKRGQSAPEALAAALLLAKGDYQRNILTGAARLSGSDIKGTAKGYASKYAASRKALLARLTAAGIPFRIVTGERGLKSLVFGDA